MEQFNPRTLRDIAVDLSSMASTADGEYIEGYIRGGAISLMLLATSLEQGQLEISEIEGHFVEMISDREMQKKMRGSRW
ncbi:hypothetical protein [Gilvimarinus chinensis]|uniref:hypothetical protein n=1 Tax=Gilvimarinus chinensis TaxID=396005 RepID=UPI0003652B2E|nr:hypothetical protein [Gilvimarinus chinensis]